MYGCEDQAVICIDDCVNPELTTRAHSLLVMITSTVRSESARKLQKTLDTNSSLITHITVGEPHQQTEDLTMIC